MPDLPIPDAGTPDAGTPDPGAVNEIGCIDSYGFSHAAGAWMAIGWSPRLPARTQECAIVLHFARASVSGRCHRAGFSRADLPPACEGIVILASCSGRSLGPLVCIELSWPGGEAKLFSTEQVEQLSDSRITAAARTILTAAPRDGGSMAIMRALSRPGFSGASTLHELGAPIHLAVDEVIRCGDAGIVLIGWFVAEENAMRRLILRIGHLTHPIDLGCAVRIRRPDVTASLMESTGLYEPEPGFILFAPDVAVPDDKAHLEVETSDLAVGHVALPQARLRGIPAMRRMLECHTLRYEDMVRAYDRVLGPAIAGLNEDRLKTRVGATAFCFGPQPAAPVCSVIVPLYGRTDFMEYQLALFSREPSNARHEFIYVLDDPGIKAETLSLAETCFARFGLPFRLLVLTRNVGYAPANNAGLRDAKGRHVCFLNSDVFPGCDDWIDRLVARLEDDPKLGAVGPVLLFEDDTVQHRGLAYESLPECGGWLFPMHPGKGMRRPPRRGLEHHRAITGACLVARRSVIEDLDGFDESFAIGDFEDSDLCLRIARLGLSCAVDLDVTLYHLERQSQGDMANSWRFNLTLYNAWVHENRWRASLAASRRLEAAG